MRSLVRLTLLSLMLGALAGAPARGVDEPCASRLLVLSAFPGEIDALLTETASNGGQVVDAEGHTFYVGTLRGQDVALTLTGIGLVNAKATTEAALRAFRCGSETAIVGIVFSGVAGGASNIGDVTVPSTWTTTEDAPVYQTDATMLDVARDVADDVELTRDVAAGDPACAGIDPAAATTVRFEHAPRIIIGGEGKSADPFGGRAFPCIPGGGDVFGCRPCRAPIGSAPDVLGFVSGAQPFLDPNFFLDYFASPPPAETEFVAEDMETAAVAEVAAVHAIPFIAFRGVSDGAGDPLMLPGFPFQFFYYRQIAADNAAAVTLAFLHAWPGTHAA